MTSSTTTLQRVPDVRPVDAPERVRRRQSLLAFALYAVLALVATWPWVTDPGGILYGVVGGDQTASIASVDHYVDAGQPPWLAGRLPAVDAPEGLEVTWALNLAGCGSSTALWLLSLAIGSVAAHGLMAVLGMVLSAFAMFLLLRRTTGSFGIALVIGTAFGFWPYTYVTGWTWPHYIHLWVFVLLFWRMLVLSEQPTARNGLLAGAAAVVAMTWIQYNLLIAAVLFATMAAVTLVRARMAGTLALQLRALAVAAGVIGSVALAVVAAAAAQDFTGLPARAADDAFANSARPLMYLLPGRNHPLLGGSVGEWLQDKYVGPALDPSSTAMYATIYLGIPLLVLAMVGIVALARTVRSHARPIPRWSWEDVFAAAAGLVALVFSAPPRVDVLGVSVPLPYSLVNEITPVFRAAHRFAVIVMLAVCVLAAIGLKRLLRGGRPGLQVAVLAAVAATIFVDLWAVPRTDRTTQLVRPAIYELLAEQPRGIVAEYPFRDVGWVGSVESFEQRIHGQRLFKGFDNGTETQSRKLELQYLRAPRTVRDLARYGVDYVVIHEAGPSHPDYIPHPADRPAIPGLQLVGKRESSVLYRVTAEPSRFTTYASRGFNAPEGEPPNVTRWLAKNGATVLVIGSCDTCRGVLRFQSATFARDRVLTLRAEDGRTLFRGPVTGRARTIRIPLRFSRRTEVSFATEPPPDQINQVLGGKDTRSFGISISGVRFIPDPDQAPRQSRSRSARP